MRKIVTILAAVLALAMLTASVAVAGNGRGVEKLDIVQVFDDGVFNPPPFPTGDVTGTVKLIRRDDGLKATVHASGLTPGGVYTFWWIVGDAPVSPPDFFAALGGSKVVGQSGKATIHMNAEAGQEGIKNFVGDGTTAPFHDTFDLDPLTTPVHVEIAYHGQAEDANGDLGTWMSDFWTGTACPIEGPAGPHNPVGTADPKNGPGQPHCPVSYIAHTEEIPAP